MDKMYVVHLPYTTKRFSSFSNSVHLQGIYFLLNHRFWRLFSQEKRVDKATLEMEPEYPPRYFDDLAKDLCTSKGTC